SRARRLGGVVIDKIFEMIAQREVGVGVDRIRTFTLGLDQCGDSVNGQMVFVITLPTQKGVFARPGPENVIADTAIQIVVIATTLKRVIPGFAVKFVVP